MEFKKNISSLLSVLFLMNCFPLNVLAEGFSVSNHKRETIGEAGGYLEGALHSTHNIFSESNFQWAQGHGFAAETANNLNDRLHGKNATVVGGDNVKNGPDRKIINHDGSVIWIQDKYSQTARESLEAAFDNETLQYKYLDATGAPMQLEVPADQYNEVVLQLKEKIKAGKVPGISDPEEAPSLVRKGKYTYQQAKNLTKAGNIDSLKYDATNGLIIATCSLGISFVLDYVACVMNGQTPADALKSSGLNALKTGGFVFATYVISSQLCKTGLTTALAPTTDAIAKALGDRLSKAILDSFGVKYAGMSSAKIAAHVSKILQSQIVVEGVILVALTVPDIIDLFRGRISSEQLLKNLTVTVLAGAGGLGGYVGGSALGTAIAPGVGTVIGGIVGGLAGSVGIGALGEWALGKFLKDDADDMFEVVQCEFQSLADDFLISQDEADTIISTLQQKLSDKTLKDMYASEDRNKFAQELMIPLFQEQVQLRKRIDIPAEEEVRATMLNDLNGILFLH